MRPAGDAFVGTGISADKSNLSNSLLWAVFKIVLSLRAVCEVWAEIRSTVSISGSPVPFIPRGGGGVQL